MSDGPDPSRWRGVVNGILYAVQFSPALGDAEVERVAGMIVRGRGLTGGPALYADAVSRALAQPGDLDTSIGTPHGEAEIRDFLARLARVLPTGGASTG